MIHSLKVSKSFYKIIKNGKKVIDIKNGREFGIGDLIIFREWDGKSFTGRKTERVVFWVCSKEDKKGRIIIGITENEMWI